MKKLFISVPMKGRTEDAIKASMKKMHKIAEAYTGMKLEVIDSYIEENPPEDAKEAVWFLGKSIQLLSEADYFIGIEDAWDWSGCFIEREAAWRYGIRSFTVPVAIVAPDEVRDEELDVPCR